MRKSSVICVLLLACGMSCQPAPVGAPAGTFVPASHEDFGVYRLEWRDNLVAQHGTAFAVLFDGKVWVLSAAHVVDGPGVPTLKDFERRPLPVRLGKPKVLKNVDLVAWPVEDPLGVLRPYAVGRANVGADLVMYGYPENGDCVEAAGKILDMRVYSSCDVRSGMSGGPVLHAGKVVGFIHGYSQDPVTGGRLGAVHVPIEVVSEAVK